MRKNMRKPNIRFRNYNNDWEQRRLGEILTERNVQHPQNKEYPLVSFTVENGVTPKTDRYEREQLVRGDKSQKKYKATELDDIVYNPANLKFGAIARNKYGKAVFSPIYVTFEVNKQLALPMYVERFVTRQDFIQYSLQYQQGTVYERQSVSPEDLLSLGIPIPSTEEQKEIGKLFDSFDTLITLHQRKLNYLESAKTTFLNMMFPKKDANVPEYRFAKYNDVWEQRKLEEIVEVNSGRDYKHLSFGEIPVFGTGGYMLSVDQALSTNQDAVGIGRKGTVDKPFILKSPFWTVDTLFYCIPSKNDSIEFVSNIFRNINWKRFDESTGVPSLSKATINSIIVSTPKIEEQKAIGKLFSNLENTITLHQRKLEGLEDIKKYYLKHMFV